jgi:hypothetical protein
MKNRQKNLGDSETTLFRIGIWLDILANFESLSFLELVMSTPQVNFDDFFQGAIVSLTFKTTSVAVYFACKQ